MRKQLFLLAMVLAFLTGCANSEDVLDSMSNDEQVLTDEQLMSTVPIRFAPSTITATIEEMPVTRTSAGNNDVINDLGMFCLAKRAIGDGITENQKPSWSGKASALVNKMSLWKNNISVGLKITGEDKGDIIWDQTMNPDYFPYYPDKDWFAYGFVAYYPRTENIVREYSRIWAYIKLDGSKPVFYSMAKEPLIDIDAQTNSLGFSKSYYEKITQEREGLEKYIYPYFEFEYLTSALNFIFASRETPQTNLHVEKVEFDEFPCIMQLGMAYLQRLSDKSAYNMKSTISKKPFVLNQDSLNKLKQKYPTELESLTRAFGHFELYDEDGTSISGKKNTDGSYKYIVTTEQKKVGGSLYIPPVYSGHSREELNIYITLADDYGNKYKSVTPVKVSSKTGWKKGTSYDIPIRLNNPSEVAKDATLAEWEAADPIEVNATLTNWVQQP